MTGTLRVGTFLEGESIVVHSSEKQCGYDAVDVNAIESNPEFQQATSLEIRCSYCGTVALMPREFMAETLVDHRLTIDPVRSDDCIDFVLKPE